ncbi:MAG TPA: M13 family metallopeptidase, partial [Steroidobacteraceae bacterium]|nr:M13 family metallopeptidase [Steroidobacteraceae bacterium]
MSSSRPVLLAAIASAVAALAGCHRAPETKPPVAAAPAWTLDEGQLIQPIRFLASDVDPAKNACVDLATYANSKWLAANPIPADQTRWGGFNVLRERSLQVQKQLAEQIAAKAELTGIEKIIGDLWATGMDEAKLNAEGIAPLKDRLGEIEALKDGPGVATYLRAVAARGENPLFGFGPQPDFKDSSIQMAAASQGGTGLPDKTYYFDARYKPIREAYVKHIAKVLELSGIPAASAAVEAKQVMAFETRLAKASKSEEELSRDVSLYYNPVTPADADKLAPNFPWTAFFESQKVALPAKFSLSMPDFHREVSRMLSDVPAAGWKSYLRYHLVDDASPYLSEEFVAERFEFYNKTLNGQKEQRARWKRVLAHIEGAAGEAMGQIYVQVAFPPESRARMETLVGNLREALKGRIENLTWMSDATKAKALEKWSAFNTKIGYPSKWRDWNGLVTSRQSYLDNIFAADAFNYRYELDKIGKPVDKTEWHMTPQTVNAYYDPQQNEIVFPAAILQPPFFDPKADDALNYGAIGAVIGHELTHGYDDQGARFGPSGNFEEWWTPEDKKKFEALTGKLVKQYSGYEPIPGEKVNGNLTLGENIADLGGLNIAYDAMQRATKDQPDPKVDGLTRDQRFFLGYAAAWRDQVRPEALRVQLASDPHSPGAIRANGTPSNVPAFAAAFSCKAGEPMANAA